MYMGSRNFSRGNRKMIGRPLGYFSETLGNFLATENIMIGKAIDRNVERTMIGSSSSQLTAWIGN
jgi:hypothetical protein